MFLEKINSPADVKSLSAKELPALCDEVREVLMQTVSQNGGHLASNLGTVELTVALHRQFDSPHDQIVFDVGHQCYTHKLLTGRYNRFASLRKQGGLSGFTRPEESEHDVFISGHSSTSISAGLGLAVANRLQENSHYTISVIGDGALTGGLAYEGLNNTGRMKNHRQIVVLNDNKMSISGNVGGMARHLSVIRLRPGYSKAKNRFAHFLIGIPFAGKWLHRVFFRLKTIAKNLLYHSTVFEELGFSYVGPIDGHDLSALEKAFQVAKHTHRPALVHVCTCKGKGYSFAEKTPKNYHGVSSGMDLGTGECMPASNSFSHVFGQTLCCLAEQNPKVCAVTAAMCDGTGLTDFSQQFPERFFDVGIAEGHAITFASGLAKGGMIPFVAIYSSFLQRGYDQLIHDVAAQGVKVVLCIDRAGFVGEDGEMHNGTFDASFLRTVPNITVYSPANFAQLKVALEQAICAPDGVIAIRYPRGGQSETIADCNFGLEYDKVVDHHSDTALVSYGRLVGECVDAANGCGVDMVAIHQIKPLPDSLLKTLGTYKNLYFIEESVEIGGVSQEILASLCKIGYNGSVHIKTVGNGLVPHSTVTECMVRHGFTSPQIAEWIIAGKEDACE
ncbi:MAG: 1-deoxy-D-xylulose-5-phosphate synthase [Clostridia bacterium]|nr:1-deoxy-D-xylulose-5-phosphate synthase [Clostridia bacterium]